MEKSSAEISNEIVEKEKKLKNALNNRSTLEKEILYLQRDILGIQAKKKDLEISLSKAKQISRELEIDIKLKEKEFWAAKNSGI